MRLCYALPLAVEGWQAAAECDSQLNQRLCPAGFPYALLVCLRVRCGMRQGGLVAGTRRRKAGSF